MSNKLSTTTAAPATNTGTDLVTNLGTELGAEQGYRHYVQPLTNAEQQAVQTLSDHGYYYQPIDICVLTRAEEKIARALFKRSKAKIERQHALTISEMVDAEMGFATPSATSPNKKGAIKAANDDRKKLVEDFTSNIDGLDWHHAIPAQLCPYRDAPDEDMRRTVIWWQKELQTKVVRLPHAHHDTVHMLCRRNLQGMFGHKLQNGHYVSGELKATIHIPVHNGFIWGLKTPECSIQNRNITMPVHKQGDEPSAYNPLLTPAHPEARYKARHRTLG